MSSALCIMCPDLYIDQTGCTLQGGLSLDPIQEIGLKVGLSISLRVGSLFGETVVLASMCSCIYYEDDLCTVIETLAGFKLAPASPQKC